MVTITAAGISDSAGAQEIIAGIQRRWLLLKRLFEEGAYDRAKPMDAAAYWDFVLEIVRRSDTQVGFKVLPRR